MGVMRRPSRVPSAAARDQPRPAGLHHAAPLDNYRECYWQLAPGGYIPGQMCERRPGSQAAPGYGRFTSDTDAIFSPCRAAGAPVLERRHTQHRGRCVTPCRQTGTAERRRLAAGSRRSLDAGGRLVRAHQRYAQHTAPSHYWSS